METIRDFCLTGAITNIEYYPEGYSRITIQSTEGDIVEEARIVFFKHLDEKYNGRVVDYKQSEVPNSDLSQSIRGTNFLESISASREEIEKFRGRKEFVPMRELTVAGTTE